MTERLYYTDSFVQTFEARVVDVRSLAAGTADGLRPVGVLSHQRRAAI